jgi:non-specific serine/threonine protein kinase/serine/threonine-protein kinase
VIKPEMDTREVIARFEAELKALAMMDHPPGGAARETRAVCHRDLKPTNILVLKDRDLGLAFCDRMWPDRSRRS